MLCGSISLIGVLRGRKAEHLGDLVCIPVIIPHLARLDKGDDGAVLIDHIRHIVIRDPQQDPRSAQYLPRGIEDLLRPAVVIQEIGVIPLFVVATRKNSVTLYRSSSFSSPWQRTVYSSCTQE